MLSNILFILLGAGLVSVGFLGAALAERLRGPRTMELHREPRQVSRPTPVNESAEAIRPTAVRSPRAPRTTEGGEDVIAALVASGYKKSFATDATWACTLVERASIEGWTAAALRRCARGGLS